MFTTRMIKTEEVETKDMLLKLLTIKISKEANTMQEESINKALTKKLILKFWMMRDLSNNIIMAGKITSIKWTVW